MANKKHLNILENGVDLWNYWRQDDPESRPDLSGADLRFANLRVQRARDQNGMMLFRRADLSNTDLSGSILRGMDLRGVDMPGANLQGADLGDAVIINSDFDRATLKEARLCWTIFQGVVFSHADFTDALLDRTIFSDVILTGAKGLDTCSHMFRSSIDIQTLWRNPGLPQEFLKGCGFSNQMIFQLPDFIPSYVGDYHSCCISNATQDERFARKLYSDLKDAGVQCWFFPEDAKWGRPIWTEIGEGIKHHDKLIVVCSKASLNSKPVQREIERGLQREDSEGCEIVIPITMDAYLFHEWQHSRKADINEKVVGNFEEWDTNSSTYKEALQKLLKALRRHNSTDF